jgi:hypothetical protein
MECEKRNKWFGGCKFEPRYDLIPPDLAGMEFEGHGFNRIVESMTKKKYVCDICAKCGKTINRPQ